MKLLRVANAEWRDGGWKDDRFVTPEDNAKYPHDVLGTVEDGCGWQTDGGWSDRRCGRPNPCPEHGTARCHNCGAPATHGCPNAGSFVCGYPACDRCTYCSVRHGAPVLERGQDD